MKLLMTLSLLCTTPIPAWAQGTHPQAPAPQANRLNVDPTQFVDAAVQIVRAVEAGQGGPVWDAASPVMKAATTRDQFLGAVQRRLSSAGPFTMADWSSVSRTRVGPQTPKVPQGDYLTVTFIGTGRNGTAMRWSVSFRFDADATWRLAGYAPL